MDAEWGESKINISRSRCDVELLVNLGQLGMSQEEQEDLKRDSERT